MAVRDPTKKVQSLDFSLFLKGTDYQRQEFCGDLLQAFSRLGFVKLINHGIGEDVIQELFGWNCCFFALPPDIKKKAAHPQCPNPHRGWSDVGQEKVSMVTDYEKGVRDEKVTYDVKESFDQGCANDDLYPNIWVDESDLPGFRSFMEHFYEKCHAVHMNILHAIEKAMNLNEGFFEKMCDQNTSELRLNHYPACDSETLKRGNANRISEHTDFGTVTLLFQDSVGGLEVEDQTQHGLFIPIRNEHRAEMIVNIGDCLQRWTNDILHSANHRVRLPPAFEGTRVNDRYSIAYFAKPNRKQPVGTLKEFIAKGAVARYENMTAWEFNQTKLVRTY